VLAAAVTAVGAALAYSAIPLIIMDAVPATETAAANSLNTLMRMLGTSSCSAVFAAVATGLVIEIGGLPVPAAGAFVVVFLAAAGAALLAMVITALNRGGTGYEAAGRESKQELVACAHSLPAPSVSRASASVVRPPMCSSRPSQRTGPESAPRPRRNVTDRSKLA
jgi:hypothetical protein